MRRGRTALTFLFLILAGVRPAAAQCDPYQLLEVEAWNGSAGHGYGTHVALSGDTILTAGWPCCGGSAPHHAYFNRRDEGGPNAWGLSAELAPPNLGKVFREVAIDGDTAVAAGTVVVSELVIDQGVFVMDRKTGGPEAWGEVKTIENPSFQNGLFGNDMSVSGERFLIASNTASVQGVSAAGAVYVYERGPVGVGDWNLTAILSEPLLQDSGFFGSAVALSGDEAAVTTTGSGLAYVFRRDLGGPNNWGLVATLVPSGTPVFFGFFEMDRSDDTIVIGDHGHQGSEGAAYVFERDLGGPDAWGERARLELTIPNAIDRFGWDVAIDDETILVGAPGRLEAGVPTGTAFVYRRDEGGANAWGKVGKLVATNAEAFDSFGTSVDIEGTTAVVGTPSKNNSKGGGAGTVYLFADVGVAAPVSYCTAGVSASGCQALLSVSGTPSATAGSGFLLQAAGIEGAKDGLFFFGANGRQGNPWGSGTSYQCIVPPLSRGGLLPGVGTSGACDGGFSQDLNARWAAKPNQNPGAGAVLQAQLWYRDPQNSSNQTTSLSDAVEFTLCP